ncbi:MAG: hypothetical protein MHM6MM_003823, partial [Cercozoa sp. M6MM]
ALEKAAAQAKQTPQERLDALLDKEWDRDDTGGYLDGLAVATRLLQPVYLRVLMPPITGVDTSTTLDTQDHDVDMQGGADLLPPGLSHQHAEYFFVDDTGGWRGPFAWERFARWYALGALDSARAIRVGAKGKKLRPQNPRLVRLMARHEWARNRTLWQVKVTPNDVARGPFTAAAMRFWYENGQLPPEALVREVSFPLCGHRQRYAHEHVQAMQVPEDTAHVGFEYAKDAVDVFGCRAVFVYGFDGRLVPLREWRHVLRAARAQVLQDTLLSEQSSQQQTQLQMENELPDTAVQVRNGVTLRLARRVARNEAPLALLMSVQQTREREQLRRRLEQQRRQQLHQLWHYRDDDGREQGPFTTQQLALWWQQGHLPRDLPVRRATERPQAMRPICRRDDCDFVPPRWVVRLPDGTEVSKHDAGVKQLFADGTLDDPAVQLRRNDVAGDRFRALVMRDDCDFLDSDSDSDSDSENDNVNGKNDQ